MSPVRLRPGAPWFGAEMLLYCKTVERHFLAHHGPEQGCRLTVGRVELLTIDFSTMGYVEDFDISSRVIDGINNSVISDSGAVKIAIGELLGSERSWVEFKLK